MDNIKVEVLYDSPRKHRKVISLELPKGAQVRHALRALKDRNYEVGYMTVWLNAALLPDPKAGLNVKLTNGAVLHLRLVERWFVP